MAANTHKFIFKAKKPAVDLAAYPILTEEVGYPPSPLSKPSGGTSTSVPGGSGLGQMVTKAMSDVLGWKVKDGDTRGFVGALNQSFDITEVEGHVVSTWKKRTYAAQTDLSGGITGAQASLYARGKEALDQALPLLDGLYALDPEAVPEDVTALKSVVKSQLMELVNELGFLSGPRISRVNQYFGLLLLDPAGSFPPPPSLFITDPDQIRGTLGNLRDELGLNFDTQDFVNTVDDEEDLSNYRILSDYVTSLAQSWINNLPFIGLDVAKPFYGTQLILLSRQLQVVAESVDEVRFTLDSVFIGPAERQTMELSFMGGAYPSIFLEDLLSWIQGFASDEGPTLIQDGGKFAVRNTFLPVIQNLQGLVQATLTTTATSLPSGFYTARVQLSWNDLADELQELVNLASPIAHVITPQPDFGLPLQVTGVQPSIQSISALSGTTLSLLIIGSGFQSPAGTVTLTNGSSSFVVPAGSVFFRSEGLLVAQFNLAAAQGALGYGAWTIEVTNPDGSAPAVLDNCLTITA
jgi:hypothetical protein